MRIQTVSQAPKFGLILNFFIYLIVINVLDKVNFTGLFEHSNKSYSTFDQSMEHIIVGHTTTITEQKHIKQNKANIYSNKEKTRTRSHPEMVGDMSRVTLNFDLSNIPFVHF